MEKINIYGTLNSVTSDQKAVLSNQVYDELYTDDTTGQGLFQDKINNKFKDKFIKIDSELGALIIDSLDSDAIDKALSAKQGKELKKMIGNITTISVLVVDVLPETGKENIIYFVQKDTETSYDEYMYLTGNWELIGTTDVDLSGYYNKLEIDNFIKTLNASISKNKSSITNIINNGSKTRSTLTISRNNVILVNNWDGSGIYPTDVKILVPTSAADINLNYSDITRALGYVPAEAGMVGTGDVSGPLNAINGNFVAFDGDTGKLIKDSNYNQESFARNVHTHIQKDIVGLPVFGSLAEKNTVSITDCDFEVPVVDSILNGSSTNAIANKSVFEAIQNNTQASGNLPLDTILIGADGKSLKTSNIKISDLATSGQLTKFLPLNGGEMTGVLYISNGNLMFSTYDDRPAPVFYNDGVLGFQVSHQYSNGDTDVIFNINGVKPSSHNKLMLGTSDKSWKSIYGETIYENGTSLSSKYATISKIPTRLPNPESLTLNLPGNTVIMYNGSSAITIPLNDIFSKKLDETSVPGSAGICYIESETSVFIKNLLTPENPDGVVIVKGAAIVTFDPNLKLMSDINSLSTTGYRCYCLTCVGNQLLGNNPLILVNGAAYA